MNLFFDARRAYREVLRNDILENFDQLKTEAVAHGQLIVPARGANTVRTEFAFLSGMPAKELGIHKFNPYRKLAAQGFPTIASCLQKLGYRTVCIHPFHRGFYGRDRVLPALGFDEFIGIEEFRHAQRYGPYVSDQALAKYVVDTLQQHAGGPIYIHVITMENHGPLHLESVDKFDAAGVLNGPMPQGCEDLVAYARHLKSADFMFATIKAELTGRSRPSSLCIYGDHLPIMPTVYSTLGDWEGGTDYLLWNSVRRGRSLEVQTEVQQLGTKCLMSLAICPERGTPSR